jgi:hypothetical protein
MAEQSFQWPGRRTNDPAHDMLVAFLVMDIQRNPEWAHELADRIVEVKSGKLPVWERIGNAYRLELTGKGALIEDLVDEDGPVQMIPLKDFSKALEAWIQAYERRTSNAQR